MAVLIETLAFLVCNLKILNFLKCFELGVVAHTYNPSLQEMRQGNSSMWAWARVKILPQKISSPEILDYTCIPKCHLPWLND
jgi:hypothetical protein